MYKENRKYVRLNKVFPVEIQVFNPENKTPENLIQGFTRDVSMGGLCVQINDFHDRHLKDIREENGKVNVFLNFPLKRSHIKVEARVAWVKKLSKPYAKSCLIGLRYEVIDQKDQKSIMRFAKFSNAVPRIVGLFILLLLAVCTSLLVKNVLLVRDNAVLLDNMNNLSREQLDISQKLNKIQTEKQSLIMMMKGSAKQVIFLKKELAVLESNAQRQWENKDMAKLDKSMQELEKLKLELLRLSEENIKREKRMSEYIESQKELKSQLSEINNLRNTINNKTLELMCQWLDSAQSSKTGLVVSYDEDIKFPDVGFTYDQALSAFNMIKLNKFEKVKRIFDFYKYKAAKVNGGYANAYDVITGKVSEYIVHSGPSIYLALAVLRYEEQTSDDSYKEFAEGIARWLITLQDQTADGALPGGPGLQWASTEQNIAAYKLFSSFFDKTKEGRYDIAAKKTINWLQKHAYNKKLKRFNRGTDDIMIATDAMALSIMGLGPRMLEDMGVDIDLLVASVEENCKTKVRFNNLLGKKVEVNGFDFSCPSSVGRNGVISVEWTAQMVIAFKILGRFYEQEQMTEKAEDYMQRADYYMQELEKLIILRSNFGIRKAHAGLPYASSEGIDTGHGWFTPSERSISAAGTNFAIFAKEEYNIF